ncbi:MAG: guanine deaminase [Proteobacteria bacterium]|nr:guanine deaminase [Pseudomonadota bacterium]
MSVAHLGTLAHLRASPFEQPDALQIIEDGALLLDDRGIILQAGERRTVLTAEPEAELVDHGEAWLIPGLVDGHVHYPQYYATAAHGTDLLDWLDRSVFPAEAALADAVLARKVAEGFVGRLLQAGTTTAAVFGSQFPQANRALFEAAGTPGLRLIAGATLMDRGAPPALLQTPEQAYVHACGLIDTVRNEPRLRYAVTPRFALSCSEGMLEVCGALLREFPGVYLHTHINESRGEIHAVSRDFPWAKHYLDVYDRFALLTDKTVLAHSIYTTEAELLRLSHTNCAICHCPGSNMYLGSGLFPLHAHRRYGLRVAVGTDIGAGTHFSVWEELSDCYKVQQLLGHCLQAGELLYLGTLGGAEALSLEEETGNFSPGKSGDFFVLTLDEDTYLQERLARCESLEDQLFCLQHLATARHIAATYVCGQRVKR